MADNETELTLGTGKLLGLFFALVVLCAIFFGLGYSWGKKSGPPPGSLIGENASPDAVAVEGGPKPSARPAPTEETPSPAALPVDANPAVTLGGDTAQPASEAAVAAAETKPAPASAKPAPAAPEMTKPSVPGQGYTVQVAAVSKQEDAEALAAALRKKQYPVYLAPGSDKYFHVQVGPFADLKEAEAMKARLLGDGYNAILKR